MAVIFSYPSAVPSLTDTVIGNKYYEGEGLVTKTFFISDIINLYTTDLDSIYARLVSPVFTLGITTNSDAIINSRTVGKGNNSLSGNTAFGYQALYSTYSTSFPEGNNNTAVGYATLRLNQLGDSNAAFGYNALSVQTNGSYNTAFGFWSGVRKTGGSNCTYMGTYSGQNDLTLTNNSSLGYNSLSTNTLYSNCTGIGYNAQVTAANQLQLGDSATIVLTQVAIQLRSDARDKTDIRDTILGLEFINSLRPVDYRWDIREDYKQNPPAQLKENPTEREKSNFKILNDIWLESVNMDNLIHDGTHTRTRFHHGLIAQEVKQVIDTTGVDFGGFQDHKIKGGQDVLSLGYEELIAPMIKAIQELKAEIELLKLK